MSKQTFKSLQEEKACLEKAGEDAKQALSAFQIRLKTECTHEALDVKRHRVAGGYLDRGFTDYWDECQLCGARFNMRTVDGSHG